MKSLSIKENYAYNILYNIFSFALPLITVPYASRVLGPDGIGVQSYVTSITTYFILLGSLGIAYYGRQEIAMIRDDRYRCSIVFWELLILRFITTGIALIGYFIIINKSKGYSIYLLANTILIVASGFDFTWYFQGLENFKIIAVRNILVRVIGTACLFLLIHKKSDLFIYILILAITMLVSNLSVILKLKECVEKIPYKKLNPIKHLKEVLVFFIPTIASSIYTVFDKLMLGILSGSEFENGYYEQSECIINIVNNILFSLNVVVGVRISYLYAHKKIEEIRLRLTEAVQFVIMLSVPMTFGIIGIASNFVQWFLGSSFEKSSVLLKILAFLCIIAGINNCVGVQCLLPMGKRKYVNVVLLSGAVFNIICNLILIPKWESVGASIATVITELLITIAYLFFAREYYSIQFILKSSVKYIIAGVVMLTVVMILENKFAVSVWSTGIEIVVGIIVYIIMLVILHDKYMLEKIKNFENIKFWRK